MGLTRPRAHQLQDIDYKQAVRVISTSNVTLSGGAPNEVDGVSLVLGDRILVAGQTDASQNGLYQVTTVGAGSSGTWARTATADETGEINAGMIVMVTEGTSNADTQWKLTTDNPITVGTTDLTFEQASAYAFGTISANGTSIVADSVGDTVTFTPGTNISITGNASSDTITIGVTGIALDSINSGTSNVSVVSSGGNVTVGIAGSEVAEFSSSGLAITGDVSATNITGTLTTAAQPNITSVGTLSSLSVTGNISSGNISTSGELKSTGTFLLGTQQFYAQGSDGFSVNENFNAGNSTVTAYHYTSGSGRDAIVFDTAVTGQFTTGFGTTGNAASNKFVFFAEFGNTVWEYRKSVGIQAPDLNGGTLLANINADGNLYTLGTITGTGNITGGNITTAGQLTVTGNISGGNLSGTLISGTLSTAAQPNVTSVGTLNGLTVAGNILPSANVTYNLGSDTARWNELFLAGSTLNLGALQLKDNGGSFEVFQSDGTTPAQVKGNIAAANVVGTVSSATTAATVTTAAQPNITSVGTLSSLTVSGNVSSGNVSGTLVSGTLSTAAQPNVTSVGTLTSLTTSGNLEIQGQNQLRLFDTDSSHYVALRSAGTVSANVTWTLPSSDGSDGQVLTTNGGGTLSFADAGGGATGSSYPNSTISTLPSKDGNFDLSYNVAQTEQEVPFESGGTDAFGVNLGSVFDMMDPIGSVETAAEGGNDLGVLT